jgi:uncharacterized protein YjbI with pentapeptide repeats
MGTRTKEEIVPRVKRRWFRFGIRTGLGTIAVLAVALALLDIRLRAPYRAEQQAAAALTRLGGNVLMVDTAPRWLRRYVGVGRLDMRVAATIDLSHSRVTDADLVHLQAFQHFGKLNLSDTEVSDAGLDRLREVVAYRFIDLSRTRVTTASRLFGNKSQCHPSGMKLSGNRLAPGTILFANPQWCPLQELDLSDTNLDDQMLESLPDGLVNLSSLDLSGTEVSDLRVLTLLRFEGLTKLDLRGTKVTAEGVTKLKAHWRGTRPLAVLTGSKPGTRKAPVGVSPSK